MAILRELGGLEYGLGVYLPHWRAALGTSIVVVEYGGNAVCRCRLHRVLHCLRAYMRGWEVESLSGALGATGCAKNMSKHIKNKCIPFYAHERAIESVNGAGSCSRCTKSKAQPLDHWSDRQTVTIEQGEWMFLKLSYD